MKSKADRETLRAIADAMKLWNIRTYRTWNELVEGEARYDSEGEEYHPALRAKKFDIP